VKRALFGSLQAKILFYSFLPFVLVVVIIVIVGVQVFERVPQRIAQQREAELARVVAGQVERTLAEVTSALSRFGSALIDGRVGGGQEGDMQAGEFHVPIDRDLFDGGIAVLDPSGSTVLAEPAGQDWDAMISRDLQRIVDERQPMYSDVIRNPLTGEPALVLAVPVDGPQGEVKLVVAAVSTLAGSRITESFAALMEFQRGRSGHTYLVDGKGKFIYHRDRSLRGIALAGTIPLMQATYGLSGAAVAKEASGQRVITGFAPVAGTRWALVTRERWDIIVGPVRLYSLVLLAVLVIGGAASAMLVLFAVGRILKPIRELTEGAERIAAGQFDHRIMAVTGDEIEDLAHQFNTMADSLKSLYHGLERRVQERTREVLQQQRQLAVIEERGRLARDLHDSVSQSLYSVTLFAEAARRQLTKENTESAGQSLDQLIDASQQALREMRLMVFELRPSELEQQGLIGALRQRLNTVEKRAGIAAQLDAPSALELPVMLEQELYSLAQEALNNALKHGKAGSVLLRLHEQSDVVELEVRDNGLGFDVDSLPSSGGMGIRGMRERTKKLGGRLIIESSPGQGSLVRVVVPKNIEEQV
jgi:signal transduction histidine kinase